MTTWQKGIPNSLSNNLQTKNTIVYKNHVTSTMLPLLSLWGLSDRFMASAMLTDTLSPFIATLLLVHLSTRHWVFALGAIYHFCSPIVAVGVLRVQINWIDAHWQPGDHTRPSFSCPSDSYSYLWNYRLCLDQDIPVWGIAGIIG